MNTTILLPIFALFIGACSGIVGTFYMRALPSFPLTAWWWQWGQRFEISHPNLFKAVWGCVNCFSGHVGWVTFLMFQMAVLPFSHIVVFIFSFVLAAATGYISAIIFNPLFDKNDTNKWN